MEDLDLEMIMLEGRCPKCSGDNLVSSEEPDDSMDFECLDCGWTGNATESQVLNFVALASQYPLLE